MVITVWTPQKLASGNSSQTRNFLVQNPAYWVLPLTPHVELKPVWMCRDVICL